jgi:hypothetical protein
VTPIPQVKSSIRLPSSKIIYDPSPLDIMPSVKRPSPLVTCLSPNVCNELVLEVTTFLRFVGVGSRGKIDDDASDSTDLLLRLSG